MGAPIMNKVLSMLGIADENKIAENIDEVEGMYEDNEMEYSDASSYNDYEEEGMYEEEVVEPEKKLFSFYKPKKQEEPEKEYIPSISRRTQARSMPMTSVSNTKMIISHPQNFEAIREIAENVKAKRSVIVNLEAVSHEDGRRIVDFLSGTAHALDGTIQKVSKLIFLIAPKDIEVEDESEKYNYSSKLNMSWLKK